MKSFIFSGPEMDDADTISLCFFSRHSRINLQSFSPRVSQKRSRVLVSTFLAGSSFARG